MVNKCRLLKNNRRKGLQSRWWLISDLNELH